MQLLTSAFLPHNAMCKCSLCCRPVSIRPSFCHIHVLYPDSWRQFSNFFLFPVAPHSSFFNPCAGTQWPSKSYLTPPRWWGLANGSTPVSHHITTCLRKVDENVNPTKFRRLCSAFPHLGFGVPCLCGVGGPWPGGSALLVSWFVRWVSTKYLDPAGDRYQCGPQNQAYGGTNISGDCPSGLSMQGVTSDLATCGPVQDVLAQGILDKIYHWGLWMGVD